MENGNTLSQEEKKLINFAKKFIRQAGIATKNFRMFGDDHPVIIGNIDNLYDLLQSGLAHRDSVTYTFLESTLLVEDTRLKEMDPKTYSLIAELDDCGITSLTFQSGISKEELRLLLKSISMGPGPMEENGGLGGIFQKKNVAHIRVDETFFKRVSKKDEEAKGAKDRLADILIVDYLSGKTAFSAGETANLASEITKIEYRATGRQAGLCGYRREYKRRIGRTCLPKHRKAGFRHAKRGQIRR